MVKDRLWLVELCKHNPCIIQTLLCDSYHSSDFQITSLSYRDIQKLAYILKRSIIRLTRKQFPNQRCDAFAPNNISFRKLHHNRTAQLNIGHCSVYSMLNLIMHRSGNLFHWCPCSPDRFNQQTSCVMCVKHYYSQHFSYVNCRAWTPQASEMSDKTAFSKTASVW